MAVLIDRFIGQHNYSLDNKGRVSIPAKFREVLAERYDERLVLMKDYASCVLAYPIEEWQKLDERIRQLPTSDPNVTRFLRKYYSSAEACELDGQGRVLIPQPLKSHASLSREVVIIGMSNRMEIWDAKSWAKGDQDEDTGSLQAAMAAYGL